jgi:predicted transposase YbfD/YdcC
LWSILALIVVSILCGRRGMAAAFRLGRELKKRQRHALGFMKGTTPCHETLTETLRAIDARALAEALGAAGCGEGADATLVAIDGKTMRASKDGEGNATHVLSAFCAGLDTIRGHEASRGKGMEIPDALELLDQLDLSGKIVTGDAMFCQKAIVGKIADKGGGYVFPVKDNQKTLREDIVTAFNEPVFPLTSFDSGLEKAHGRIEQRSIEVLPAAAAGIETDWPSVTHICRITRLRQVRKGGQWQERAPEVVHLIARLPKPASAQAASEISPRAILNANRGHWGIEIMHRNKDVILGEDGYTNRSDAAPRNIFSLLGFALGILHAVSPSPTRAIEHFQDDKNRVLKCFAP